MQRWEVHEDGDFLAEGAQLLEQLSEEVREDLQLLAVGVGMLLRKSAPRRHERQPGRQKFGLNRTISSSARGIIESGPCRARGS